MLEARQSERSVAQRTRRASLSGAADALWTEVQRSGAGGRARLQGRRSEAVQ